MRSGQVSQELTSIRELTAEWQCAEGLGLISHCGAALLNNGLSRYSMALVAAERACEYPQELGFSIVVLPELIEAASRTGRTKQAARAIERLVEATRVVGTDWALGIEARSSALVSEGEAAEYLYREAIERLGRTSAPMELARAHLLYGEWLRRENRRIAARGELRIAHEMFVGMGADVFVERASRELLATGETARKRTVDTRFDLTAQEEEIARLAGDGRTNNEIGTELFISPRTVEWHLRKVFPKLGISSRRELRIALPNRRPVMVSV
jgi:DNA-binding CsgD family transcriptional regulator